MKINEVVTIKEDAMEIAKTLMSLSGEEIVALSAALTMTVPVLKGLFKTGKGIMKVKRMMDRASVRIANGIVNEIEYTNDIRLAATTDNVLDESIGALMGMVLPSHAKMYNKAAEMMSSFHVEFPSYGLNKLAALVSRRTAHDFDRRALVKVFNKQYPNVTISEQDIEK